jgi:drug/metabolite transporter (DMT)-like permease
VRALLSGVVLLPVAVYELRSLRPQVKPLRLIRASWKQITVYALIAVIATQLTYFSAIVFLDVSTAVLIKCTAPVLVVLWIWIRTGSAPGPLTIIGAIVTLIGVVMVVNPGGGDQKISVVGVVLALLAAVAMAAYFFANSHTSGTGLPPVTLLSLGLAIGGTFTGLIGICGIAPFTMTFDTAAVAGNPWPWYAPMAILIVLATVMPYVCGLLGTRLAGPRVASFIALTETIFAALTAWAILGQDLAVIQIVGGALVLAGVFSVQRDRS